MTQSQTFGTRPTLGGLFLQHAIVFLICVVFPGLVTFMAPVTWISFQRNAENVQCTTRTCMFFVVPFKTQRVDPVTELGKRERAGKTERQRRLGRTTDKTVQVDGEGFLQIHGVDGQLVEVSVSPASLDSVLAKANKFMTVSEESTTTLFAIANWKFGAIMGGVLTSFTLLFVAGYMLGLLKWMVVSLRKLRA